MCVMYNVLYCTNLYLSCIRFNTSFLCRNVRWRVASKRYVASNETIYAFAFWGAYWFLVSCGHQQTKFEWSSVTDRDWYSLLTVTVVASALKSHDIEYTGYTYIQNSSTVHWTKSVDQKEKYHPHHFVVRICKQWLLT